MSDTSRHLTYLMLENFKRFESLEIGALGQFNLIVGDNNVGKTSVLEALLVDGDCYYSVHRLVTLLRLKKLKSEFVYDDLLLFHNKNSKSKLEKTIFFRLKFEKSKELNLTLRVDSITGNFAFGPDVKSDGRMVEAHITDIMGINPSIDSPLILLNQGHDVDLTNFYSKLQENRTLKKNFLKNLKSLITNLEDIELSKPYSNADPHLIVSQLNLDSTIPLALFGEGTIRLFRILAHISLNQGKRLMIDEVDTGIHYSRMREFWKVILMAAKENDVQLFMTTHDQECIKYFKEVLEEELTDYQNISRSVVLVENSKTFKVTAHTYSYEELEHAINVGNEIRA